MSTTHTPGPWSAGKASAIHDQHIIFTDAETKPGCDTVAVVYGLDEHDANAALIAAAPELLAALDVLSEQAAAIVHLAGNYWHDQPSRVIASLDALVRINTYARAAISKARGNSRETV